MQSEKHVKNFKQNKISYDEILTFKDKYDMHVEWMFIKNMLIFRHNIFYFV